MNLPINNIFVPQGAEYQAVCRGLKGVAASPKIASLPIGCQAVKSYLQPASRYQGQKILLLGLAGSLSSRFQIGDIAPYRTCIYDSGKGEVRQENCNEGLTTYLQNRLGIVNNSVVALTSDRLIHLSQEKQTLAQTYQAEVVDMEGFAVLDLLRSQGAEVAMFRVISDDFYQDLPDISPAISSQGKLQPFPLTKIFLTHPRRAGRLIRGSLTSLRVLQHLTWELFS